MKSLTKTYLIIVLMLGAITLHAQTATDDAKKLVNEGIAFHDAGKYAEAIEKYNQAIKADPNYSNSYYEKGYTLMASGKGKEAIPIIEKLLQTDPKAAGCYDMLGSIYDDDKQFDKAVEYYKKGLEANPEYQRLYFNLSISYYRQQKYTEAEAYAIDAIKHDPKHASSIRMYAMATSKLNKTDCSLLAWCNFLLIEPQTTRSPEALNNVKSILNSYVTWSNGNQINIGVDKKDNNKSAVSIATLAIMAQMQMGKDMAAADTLAFQLKTVFKVLSEQSSKQPQPFYSNYFASYFGQMANTENMPAFTRYISLSANKDENLAWFKAHQQEVTDFSKWVKEAKRSF